jgi:hypothetical protein
MKLKTSLVLLISILLSPLSLQRVNGCADSGMYDIRDMSIFAPEIIQQEKFTPFFLSYNDYYAEVGEPYGFQISIDEWKEYFGNENNADSVFYLVYSFYNSDLKQFKAALFKFKKQTEKNAFNNSLTTEKINAGLAYMEYAKELEIYTRVSYDDWTPVSFDASELSKRIDKISEFRKKEKNEFLKIRWIFQEIRAYYLLGQFQKGIDFFEKDFKGNATIGSMYYRILGYKAACLYKLKQYAASNLIYAKIYDECKQQRISAFESFHPQSEEEWKLTILNAKTIRDKELLWHLFGVYLDPLRAMREIVKLNPTSEFIELLLVRSINIAENKLLHNPVYEGQDEMYDRSSEDERDYSSYIGNPYYSWKSIDSANVKELVNFVEENTTLHFKENGVWYASAAYLNWLIGNNNRSEEWIKTGQTFSGKSEICLAQLNLIKSIVFASKLTEIQKADESYLLDLITKITSYNSLNLRPENTIRWIKTHLAMLYSKNDPIRAELCKSNASEFYKDEDNIQHMIDFMNQPYKTEWDIYIISKYFLKISELYEIQAVQKAMNYDFEGAAAIFRKNEAAGAGELSGNPFNIRIQDCHDCDHALPQKVVYTKLKFVEKMIELSKKAASEKDNQERANNYFLYANGLYNMTWYGNARVFSATAINWNYQESNRFNGYSFKKNQEVGVYYSMKEAEKNYLLAMSLSTNKEFRAKCAWMLAKCEHNAWLEDSWGEGSGDFQAGVYFKMMNDDFKDSKYYKEVIAQCGYFCTYNSPGNPVCIKNKDY